MAIEYSFVPEDIMGKGIEGKKFFALSTGKGAVSAETLEQDFFHGTTVIPGVEGTAALWVTEPGKQRVTFQIVTWEPDFDQDTFKIWDGEKLIELADRALADKLEGKKWTSGDITLEFNTVADEWGILALDTGDRKGNSEIRIKSVEWLGESQTINYPLDSPYETSSDALTVTDLSFHLTGGQVGAFDDPLTGQQLYDERDRFDVPAGWGEAVEGWISLPSGSEPVEFNLYEDGVRVSSQVLGTYIPHDKV
jgi:hypothetical protein